MKNHSVGIIKKIKIVGKWTEIWVSDQEHYDASFKTYMLDRVISKKGYDYEILMNGYNYLIGMVLVFDERCDPSDLVCRV